MTTHHGLRSRPPTVLGGSIGGGIGIQELLPHGTPDQVRFEVQRLSEHIGAGGGYILGPAHSVMADAPVENIVALIEAVREQ